MISLVELTVDDNYIASKPWQMSNEFPRHGDHISKIGVLIPASLPIPVPT